MQGKSNPSTSLQLRCCLHRATVSLGQSHKPRISPGCDSRYHWCARCRRPGNTLVQFTSAHLWYARTVCPSVIRLRVQACKSQGRLLGLCDWSKETVAPVETAASTDWLGRSTSWTLTNQWSTSWTLKNQWMDTDESVDYLTTVFYNTTFTL